ncbi:ABC-type nitrate/sulfonate/bicarbonate transport system substrate-binding protein [Clostridium algifaecis]|uniref:ABC-type nitrate/sulfonate/bicarbonate transport system substrate-binding protein n=1 Tax=Clostridium algifaecis TaxID=1472040 RepID=A0ABS4KSD1_9CLOT|nr:ABC transporter substrate-binding protein [Clostridium algifaecis]MBP2032948.1 ABC-type nitrate/sulfonate/bicarbonate transport system substrate-binding protein [Clostridium algifaecis]
MNRSTKKFLMLVLSVVVVVSTFTGCGSKKSSESNVNDSTKPYTGKFVNGKLTKPFHLKIETQTGFNEAIIADKKGFFKQVGIIPEYTGVLSPNVSLAQSVTKGDNDLFDSGHVVTIASARDAGAKLKIVLTSMVDSPDFDKTHMTWFVRSNSNIKSAKDLVGKTIAMSGRGSCAELWNAEFLRQNGVDVKKTKIVVMKDQQQEQALKQGNIDVAILHSPYNMKIKNDGGARILTTSYKIGQKAGDGQASGLAVRAFSENFIKKYPDVVKAYIVADLKAQQYIDKNYQESLKIAADYLKMNIKDMSGNIYPDQKWIKPEQINFWIKTAEKNKLTNFEVPGKVKASDLYTNSLNPYYTGELK